MKIVLVSKCSLDIEQYVEFKMSVLISPSKSFISSCWVIYYSSTCLFISTPIQMDFLSWEYHLFSHEVFHN